MKKVFVLFATIESFPRIYHIINIMILDTETFLYHITSAQVVCQLEVLVEHTVCIFVLKFEGEF